MAITFILELAVFNFSSLRSVFNKPVDLSPYTLCEGTEIHIDGINMKINNLYIDMPVTEHLPITFQLNATDEGNFYEYPLGEHTVACNTSATHYLNIHPYGNVRSLIFYFSVDNQPDFSKVKISANVKRPLYLSLWRMLVVYLLSCFIFLLKTDGTAFCTGFAKRNTKTAKIQMLVAIACALIWIVIGYMCSSSHLLFNEESKPHHQQYKELAESLEKGEVALDHIPSEGIKSAPNPYDTVYLQANGIEYKADYAYYNGRYYVYFGIVPELLIYYPYHLLTGQGFPNHAAVFLFYCLFVAATFMLFWKLCESYFMNVSFVAYLLISSSAVTFGSFTYLYFTADLYSVPIMAAMGFTVFGLLCWVYAQTDNAKLSAVLYFAGSLSMALVAGCRPQMLLYSFLALPLFWNAAFKERTLFSKKSIVQTICFVVPYFAGAALVMWYNASRFGSVFDFGANYSLTNNDMNLRGFSIERMLSGVVTFLLKPPYFTGTFPYLHTTSFDPDYLGRIVTEHYYGGIFFCGIMVWSLVLAFILRHEIAKRKMTWFFLIFLFSGIIIGMVDADRAGVLQRYASETAFGFVFASAIVLFTLMDYVGIGKDTDKAGYGYLFAAVFLKAVFLLGIAYSFMMIFNTDSGITLIKYNPELFYKVASYFSF